MLKVIHYLKLSVFIILIVTQTITSIKPYLSYKEEVEAANKYAPPLDVKIGLDLFFTDSMVQEFFIQRPRHSILPKLGSRRFSPSERLTWSLQRKVNSQEWPTIYFPMFQSICNHYGIEWVESLYMNTFILSSDSLWPGYVAKISKNEWFNFPEKGVCEVILYKNISRVFYNDKLREFAEKIQAQHLYVLKKYLYHIPGQPIDFSDRNYIVIAEKVSDLPSVAANKKAFAKMLDYQKNEIRPEFQPMIKELVQAILYTGLYDLAPHNMFLINVKDMQKIVIIDTERHCYLDSDVNFFHKDKKEVRRSALAGLGSFSRYTLGVSPGNIPQFVAYLLRLFEPEDPIKKLAQTKADELKKIKLLKNKKINDKKKAARQRKKNSKIKK